MVEVMAVFLHVLRIYMIGKLLHDAKSSRSLGRRDAVLSVETKQRNQGGKLGSRCQMSQDMDKIKNERLDLMVGMFKFGEDLIGRG